jgi:hypothetical protein
VRLRSFIAPEQTVLVEDRIDAWGSGGGPLTFDVQVEAPLPPGEFVSIQFNPLIGWTEPLPMWNLGGGRWGYILYGPLNLPGNFSYRYCRNNQCGVADDDQTPGLYGAGRELKISGQPQTASGTIGGWIGWKPLPPPTDPAVNIDTAASRGPDFMAGTALSPAYHPSFNRLLPEAFQEMAAAHANWVTLTPTWSYGRSAPGNTPPDLAPIAGQDALWPDLLAQAQAAQSAGLQVALFPTPRMNLPLDQWWADAARDDPGWWPVWFDQYGEFILHNAALASQTQAQALILGGDWLLPALPNGKLFNGQPSGAPEDAEQRWRSLIAEVRSRFNGQLLWALSDTSITTPPPFIDALDQLYLVLSLDAGETFDQRLGLSLPGWLDGVAWPVQLTLQKPVVLALSLASGDDFASQSAAYDQALQAAAAHDWISGVFSAGMYPAAHLQDAGPNIYGKPAQALLEAWFAALRAP